MPSAVIGCQQKFAASLKTNPLKRQRVSLNKRHSFSPYSNTIAEGVLYGFTGSLYKFQTRTEPICLDAWMFNSYNRGLQNMQNYARLYQDKIAMLYNKKSFILTALRLTVRLRANNSTSEILTHADSTRVHSILTF